MASLEKEADRRPDPYKRPSTWLTYHATTLRRAEKARQFSAGWNMGSSSKHSQALMPAQQEPLRWASIRPFLDEVAVHLGHCQNALEAHHRHLPQLLLLAHLSSLLPSIAEPLRVADMHESCAQLVAISPLRFGDATTSTAFRCWSNPFAWQRVTLHVSTCRWLWGLAGRRPRR